MIEFIDWSLEYVRRMRCAQVVVAAASHFIVVLFLPVFNHDDIEYT